MLRASTKSTVAHLKVAGAYPKSTGRPLQAQICTSLVDPPLFIPGYDFLGNRLDDEVKEDTKNTKVEVTKDTKVEVTKTAIVHQTGWFSILPKALLPKEGTTYYETYMNTSNSAGAMVKKTQVTPGFLQRVLYGVPEDVLAQATVESVKKTITKTTIKTGLWQKVLYGVQEEIPEDVLAQTTVESVKETVIKTTIKTGLWQKDLNEVHDEDEETVAEVEGRVAKEKQGGEKAGHC